MSFYGTIYNQISNAFDSFFVRNSGKDNKEFLSSDSIKNEEIIKADGREGQVVIDSGNQWIQLESNVENNFCKIYHKEADKSDATTHVILEKITEIPSGVSPIEIKLDDDVYIKVNNIKYDKAGHVSDLSNSYLRFHVIDASADITALTGRIQAFEENTSNTVNKAVETVGKYDDRLKQAEKDSKKGLVDIGVLESLIGPDSVLGTEDTICEIIGNVENLRETNIAAFGDKSLSEIIIKLNETNEIYKATLAGLVSRVDALEAKIL